MISFYYEGEDICGNKEEEMQLTTYAVQLDDVLDAFGRFLRGVGFQVGEIGQIEEEEFDCCLADGCEEASDGVSTGSSPTIADMEPGLPLAQPVDLDGANISAKIPGLPYGG